MVRKTSKRTAKKPANWFQKTFLSSVPRMIGGIFLVLYIITVACLSIYLRTDPIMVQFALFLGLIFTLPSWLARYGSELTIIAVAAGVSLIFIQRWRMTHKKVPVIKFQLVAIGIVLVIAAIAGVSAFKAVPVQETTGMASYLRQTYGKDFVITDITKSSGGNYIGATPTVEGVASPKDNPSLKFNVSRKLIGTTTYSDNYLSVLWESEERPRIKAVLSAIFGYEPKFSILVNTSNITTLRAEQSFARGTTPSFKEAQARFPDLKWYSLSITSKDTYDPALNAIYNQQLYALVQHFQKQSFKATFQHTFSAGETNRLCTAEWFDIQITESAEQGLSCTVSHKKPNASVVRTSRKVDINKLNVFIPNEFTKTPPAPAKGKAPLEVATFASTSDNRKRIQVEIYSIVPTTTATQWYGQTWPIISSDKALVMSLNAGVRSDIYYVRKWDGRTREVSYTVPMGDYLAYIYSTTQQTGSQPYDFRSIEPTLTSIAKTIEVKRNR